MSTRSSVASRLLSVVGAFDDEHRRLTLSEIASRCDLHVATAHRLVGELAAWGALERGSDGRYQIGRRLWDIGLLASVQTDLVELASPYLLDLYGATQATVHLAVRDNHQVLYLDRVRGNSSIPILSTIGSRLPLHATGVGKVLLANAPPEVIAEVLRDLQRVTSYTLIQPGVLRRQLAAVIRDDFATTAEELALGASSVAVPIRMGGDVVAALGIVVPTSQRKPTALVPALRVAALGIGRELAHGHARV